MGKHAGKSRTNNVKKKPKYIDEDNEIESLRVAISELDAERGSQSV